LVFLDEGSGRSCLSVGDGPHRTLTWACPRTDRLRITHFRNKPSLAYTGSSSPPSRPPLGLDRARLISVRALGRSRNACRARGGPSRPSTAPHRGSVPRLRSTNST
jgi:hypothetical protein